MRSKTISDNKVVLKCDTYRVRRVEQDREWIKTGKSIQLRTYYTINNKRFRESEFFTMAREAGADRTAMLILRR